MSNVTDVGRSTKKVKRRTTEPPDLDDPVVSDNGIRVDGLDSQLVSWKEKLMGSPCTEENGQCV